MKKVQKQRNMETDLRVRLVPITRVKQHPKNVRRHDERNLVAIERSIREFGQQTPIVVNGSWHILKGNGTHAAMLRMGESRISVIVCTHLTPAEELAYMLADNKTSDLSEFEYRGVSQILAELQEHGMSLASTGFEEFEVAPLLQADWTPTEPGTDPDDDSVNAGSGNYRVVFPVEHMRMVNRAIALFNARSGDDAPPSVAATLTGICRDYVKRNGVKRKG